MSSVINTNVQSMYASSALESNERSMSRAMNQLSSGKRTWSASVDAAGLAVAEKLTAQMRGAGMAVQNMNDGISFLQTADGALTEISNMAQRMNELAIQKANGTLDTDQTTAIETEMTALKEGIEDIQTNAKWNGLTVVDHAAIDITTAADGTATTFKATAIEAIPTSASESADIVTFIASVATQRAEIGAGINRLGYMVDSLNNQATNLAASKSRIQDTDYAKSSAELARTQIIQQAATAMLSQANQSPQSVLSLLR